MKWLIAPIHRMKKADLLMIIHSIPNENPRPPRGTTVPGLRKYIEEQRSDHWDKEASKRQNRSPAKPVKIDGISAADANEWLQTLPPFNLEAG